MKHYHEHLELLLHTRSPFGTLVMPPDSNGTEVVGFLTRTDFKMKPSDFSAGPVVKAPHFQWRGGGSGP